MQTHMHTHTDVIPGAQKERRGRCSHTQASRQGRRRPAMGKLSQPLWHIFHQCNASKQCQPQENRPEEMMLALIPLSVEQCGRVIQTLLLMRTYERAQRDRYIQTTSRTIHCQD